MSASRSCWHAYATLQIRELMQVHHRLHKLAGSLNSVCPTIDGSDSKQHTTILEMGIVEDRFHDRILSFPWTHDCQLETRRQKRKKDFLTARKPMVNTIVGGPLWPASGKCNPSFD